MIEVIRSPASTSSKGEDLPHGILRNSGSDVVSLMVGLDLEHCVTWPGPMFQ